LYDHPLLAYGTRLSKPTFSGLPLPCKGGGLRGWSLCFEENSLNEKVWEGLNFKP